MIQSDTLWRKNLFEVIDPKKLLAQGQNVIFDQEGESGLLFNMIAGGYFYVAPGLKSQKFFRNLATTLKIYYLTDNNVMSRMCLLHFEGNKCAFIPYRTMTNWRWQATERTFVPEFLQYDGGSSSESKLQKLQRIGGDFVEEASLAPGSVARCNGAKSRHPEKAISADVLLRRNQHARNRLNASISFLHSISEFLFARFPFLGKFLISNVFTYYAYYLVI
uniref:Nucleotid_trans domain-containing protein n=1 Tax=Steinernema glaseri TaxID=37863 RepID=A0A1I7ZPW7_9BILA